MADAEDESLLPGEVTETMGCGASRAAPPPATEARVAASSVEASGNAAQTVDVRTRKLREVFAYMDRDDNGSVDVGEFMLTAKATESKANIARMFGFLDSQQTQDGCITESEFVAGISALYPDDATLELELDSMMQALGAAAMAGAAYETAAEHRTEALHDITAATGLAAAHVAAAPKDGHGASDARAAVPPAAAGFHCSGAARGCATARARARAVWSRNHTCRARVAIQSQKRRTDGLARPSNNGAHGRLQIRRHVQPSKLYVRPPAVDPMRKVR